MKSWCAPAYWGSLLSMVTADTMLYNGLQKQIYWPQISQSRDAAFNTSLQCPTNIVQYLMYPIQDVGWKKEALDTLCTSACINSFSTLETAVKNSCGNGILPSQIGNFTLPEIVNYLRYQLGSVCLKDDTSNKFCLEIEASWNITKMDIAKQASWPTNTKKCYYDMSQGIWDISIDESGECSEPFSFGFQKASKVRGGQLKAADYFIEKGALIDDDNFGWPEPLEYDEYPLEIQCSTCALSQLRYGYENIWGEVWDEVSEQIWRNVKMNCGVNTVIKPAQNNSVVVRGAEISFLTPVTLKCPQNLTVSTAVMSCDQVANKFRVPSAAIQNLNPDIDCNRLQSRTLCGTLSCPIMTVNLGPGAKRDSRELVANYVKGFTNMTLQDFYSWNQYIGRGYLLHGEVICSGRSRELYQGA